MYFFFAPYLKNHGKYSVLNRLEGRSIAEIANLLKVPEKAIEYHLTKSVKELKVHLKDYILFLAIILSVTFK